MERARSGRVLARDQEVGPGEHGLDPGLLEAEVLTDGAHAQVVGDDGAFKAQLFSQEAGEDLLREGRRALRVEVLVDDVGGHDEGYPGADGGLKGRQVLGLDLGQAPLFVDREPQVAVHARVAVAGEVLGGGQHPGVLEPLDEGQAVAGDELGVGAEAAQADDRVLGVGVDVEHRGEVHVGAGVAGLLADGPGHAAGERGVVGGAERHRPREAGHAGDTEGVEGAALLVNEDEQVGAACFELVDGLDAMFEVGGKEQHPGGVELVDEVVGDLGAVPGED